MEERGNESWDACVQYMNQLGKEVDASDEFLSVRDKYVDAMQKKLELLLLMKQTDTNF